MDMDWGVLARIDRKLLSSLGDDEALRTVRVPASAAKWPTWKRYCEAARVSMGRAVTMLIDHELMSVFGDFAGGTPPVFAERAVQELAIREANLATREDRVKAADKQLRANDEQLRRRETALEAQEQRVELISKLPLRPSVAPVKIGRNERCPCGSGRKYKRCHGLPNCRT